MRNDKINLSTLKIKLFKRISRSHNPVRNFKKRILKKIPSLQENYLKLCFYLVEQIQELNWWSAPYSFIKNSRIDHLWYFSPRKTIFENFRAISDHLSVRKSRRSQMFQEQDGSLRSRIRPLSLKNWQCIKKSNETFCKKV